MTPVAAAVGRSGRKAVNVGVTTLMSTVPRGVLWSVCSFCVQFSEPGAAPGQRLTVCASLEGAARRTAAAVNAIVRRIVNDGPARLLRRAPQH